MLERTIGMELDASSVVGVIATVAGASTAMGNCSAALVGTIMAGTVKSIGTVIAGTVKLTGIVKTVDERLRDATPGDSGVLARIVNRGVAVVGVAHDPAVPAGALSDHKAAADDVVAFMSEEVDTTGVGSDSFGGVLINVGGTAPVTAASTGGISIGGISTGGMSTDAGA